MLFNDISYFVSIIDSDKIPSSSIGQTHNDETIKQQIKTQRQVTGGSDSGQGSEADDGIRMAYHFYIPNHLCGKYKKNIDNMNSMYCFLAFYTPLHYYLTSFCIGKLIGRKGDTVKQFKNETKCSIQLHERSDNFQGRYRDNRR